MTFWRNRYFNVGSGLLLRAISVYHLIVDVNGVPSYGALASVFNARPVEIQWVSTGDQDQVWVASRCNYFGRLNERTSTVIFFRACVRQEVIFGPLNVATRLFDALYYVRVLRVNVSLPANFRTRQISVDFDGSVNGVRRNFYFLCPWGNMFVRDLRVSNAVGLRRFAGRNVLSFVFDGLSDLVRPVCSAISNQAMGPIYLPSLFRRPTFLFRRPTVRAGRSKEEVTFSFLNLVRDLNFLLYRTLAMVVAYQHFCGILAVHLVCALQRGDQVRRGQRGGLA